MKYRVFSDIHLDHSMWYPKPMAYDDETTLILAGDLWTGTRLVDTMNWLHELATKFKYVVFVLGNHDYWTNRNGNADWRGIPKAFDGFLPDNVFLLEKEVIELDGVKIGGATLWTDIDGYNPLAVLDCKRYTNDFMYMPQMTPQLWMQEYKDTVEWIKTVEVDILITHYVPSAHFCHPRYRGMIESCMFNSNTIGQISKLPKVWIFGHTHDNYDETLANTKFICNPRGYSYENYDFREESLYEFNLC